MPLELYQGKSNSKDIFSIMYVQRSRDKKNRKKNKIETEQINKRKKYPLNQMCEAVGPKTRPAGNAIGLQDLPVPPFRANPREQEPCTTAPY